MATFHTKALLKHRKYRFDSLVSFFIYLSCIMTRELHVNRFLYIYHALWRENCTWIVFYLFIMHYDERTARESFFIYLSCIMTRELHVNRFYSKSIYVRRDIIIYNLTFLWFLSNVVFLMAFSPLSTRFVNITDILTVTLVTSTDSCWHH